MPMTGIYQIQNKQNGKVYIGQAKNIESRWRAHIRMLEANEHHSKKLQKDFNEMGGINAFTFSVLELCAEDKLNERESEYIKQADSVREGYNTVYNIDGEGCLMYDRPTPTGNINIPYSLFEKLKTDIVFSELSIYLYFLFVADENGEAIVSKRDLSKYFGMSKMAIKNRIDKLVRIGLVEKSKSGSFNVYKVRDTVDNPMDGLLADVKSMLTHYTDACELCKHNVACGKGECKSYTNGCTGMAFGYCEALFSTPCRECRDYSNWEWRGANETSI